VNRLALVTGASRGIGRAVADRLAAAGAMVAIHHCARADADAGMADAADAAVREIAAAGGRAFAVDVDFGAPGAADGLLAQVRERTGGRPLDVLVNNAGIVGNTGLDTITEAEFDRVLAINARTPLLLTVRAMDQLADGGRVVTVSTGLTRIAQPDHVLHAMSKAALEMLTVHLARPLAVRGITVNTVAPGVTDTGDPALAAPAVRDRLAEFSAFGRIARPGDIADIVAFLCSPAAGWTTGAWFDATGGALLG
jgi:bifunctional oxygenase/reductase